LPSPNSLDEFVKEKTLSPASISEKVQELRAAKKTIATLNGSFDLMHAGHLQIIFEASLQADVLIVALNSDASIQAYKSPERPIVSLPNRLHMMAALEFVDFVTWFEETDPRSLLNRIAPDVHVNGAEYGENCIEAETVRRAGGRMHIVPLVPGLSTSYLIAKIKKLCV
jgi:rfaE bifunctional protein nucleotidyltransferase chain/domain